MTAEQDHWFSCFQCDGRVAKHLVVAESGQASWLCDRCRDLTAAEARLAAEAQAAALVPEALPPPVEPLIEYQT